MARWLGYSLDVRYKVNQLVVTERLPPVVRTVLGVSNGLLTHEQAENSTVVMGGGWQCMDNLDQGGVDILLDSVIGNLQVGCYVIPALTGARLVAVGLA